MNALDMDQPRIWVGCLACYNSGELVGDWLPLNDPISMSVKICANQSHEELDIMDYDGFYGLKPGDVAEAVAMAEWLTELAAQWPIESGELPLGVAVEWATDVDTWENVDPSDIGDAYAGCWDSGADYAYSVVQDMGLDVPSWVSVDWEHTWEGGLRFDFNAYRHGGSLHLFHAIH